MSFFNPTTKFKADHQKSFEYAIYMIFGSYFGKTVCKSPAKEASMHINYAETPVSLQYEMEEFIDREAEKLLSGRAGELAKETVEASFVQTRGQYTEIRFIGNHTRIRLIGRYKKEGSEIRAEIWNREIKSPSPLGDRGVKCKKSQRVA
jgi:hypothetical protein